MSSCTAATTSNGPGGGSCASPTANVPSGTAAAASATAAGSMSMPVTRAPRSAAARANSPAPQPRSSTAGARPDRGRVEHRGVQGCPPAARSLAAHPAEPIRAGAPAAMSRARHGRRSTLFRRTAIRTRRRRRLALFGPAFVAAIAYVDPGNFATNVRGRRTYGYLLLWVIVVGERHGHVRAEPVGEARPGDRREPAGDVPRARTAVPVVRRPVGAGRAGRHGDRPGRGRRRGDRAATCCSGCRCSPAG